MNVKELVKILREYPEELEVWALCSGYGNAFPANREDVKPSMEREYSHEDYRQVLLIGIE